MIQYTIDNLDIETLFNLVALLLITIYLYYNRQNLKAKLDQLNNQNLNH